MSSKAEQLGKDIAEWARSLRFGWYTLLFFGVFVIGMVTLSHTMSVYVQQQQEIRTMRESLQRAQEQVAAQTKSLENWQDPEFIKAQARDRLFYVLPGESQLAIIKDIEIPRVREGVSSTELTPAKQQWTNNLLASVVVAGLATDPAVETQQAPQAPAEQQEEQKQEEVTP